ncbi:MAG: hypothetical protein J6I68_11580 [Butyrivibrio sp.]|uniref:hypothetical protein n=1 Tax=Butyrivibrio sp. TaxID=28121 RepID=UPI001B62F99F|nr:hypothetical protein [Butyrivibrio sp.]MBP3783877.1 hypothetical protein [Butyrivibrio sp.]
MLLEQGEKLIIENTMTDPRYIAIILGVILLIIFADYVVEMYICARTKQELYQMKRELLSRRRNRRSKGTK